MNFKDFLTLTEAAMLASTQTGTEAQDPVLPHLPGIDIDLNLPGIDIDLNLPTVTKASTINFIDDKRNPILVVLADGTQLFFPHDAFRRIKGEPSIGKTMTIVFQRREDDVSQQPSQIQAVYIN
jgi:hypothetical protein